MEKTCKICMVDVFNGIMSQRNNFAKLRFCEKLNARGVGVAHREETTPSLAPQSPKIQKRVDKPLNHASLPPIEQKIKNRNKNTRKHVNHVGLPMI